MPAVYIKNPATGKASMSSSTKVKSPVRIGILDDLLADPRNLILATSISISGSEANCVFNTLDGVVRYSRSGPGPGQFSISGECFYGSGGNFRGLGKLQQAYAQMVGEPFTISFGDAAYLVALGGSNFSIVGEPDTTISFTLSGTVLGSTLSKGK